MIAVYLGWGIVNPSTNNEFIKKIGDYIPYGFLLLVIYFLSLSYIRLSLTTYRLTLEKRINSIIGENILNLHSTYLDSVQSKGFLRFSKKWYGILPTPMVLLGFLIFIGAIIVFYFSNITQNKNLILCLIIACGLVALYTFYIYPAIVRKRLI